MKVQLEFKVLHFCSAKAMAVSSPPPPILRWRRIGRYGYALAVYHGEEWVQLHASHQIGAGALCRLAEGEYSDWLASWTPAHSRWNLRAKLRKGPKNPALLVRISEVSGGA